MRGSGPAIVFFKEGVEEGDKYESVELHTSGLWISTLDKSGGTWITEPAKKVDHIKWL